MAGQGLPESLGAGALQSPPAVTFLAPWRGGGHHSCWGGCRPDSVALWFTRDEIYSHPVTTVEADTARQGHGVPTPSECPMFSDSRRRASSHPQKLEGSSKPAPPGPAV